MASGDIRELIDMLLTQDGEGSGLDADKVDSFHASQTPTPDTIPVAGSDGKLDSGWLPAGSGGSSSAGDISYDNTSSGLLATNVQDAIDEVEGRVDDIEDGTVAVGNADKLDGQHGSYYRNASNLDAGTVPIDRLSGTYNIDISGNAATADSATNADKVDNFDASQTPTANTIPVAGSDGKLDSGWLPESGGDWEQNFSSNGYTKLPNGLIIQWGHGVYDSDNENGYATVTFPIQFPSGCFSVSLTPRRNLSGSQIYTVELVGTPDSSSFNLALYSEASGSFALDAGVVYWIAVGC